MKVILLIPRSGPAGAQNIGDEIEVSDAEAKRLLEAVPPKARPVRKTVAPEFAAFDHDKDGRPGGSRPKRRRRKKA